MAIRASRILRVIVIVLLCLATSLFLYLLVNNFQFTRGVSIRVHFSSVGDLNTGAWVRKSGLKVGSVTRIVPDEDEKTIVAILTFKPGQIVRTEDQFALVSKGILGDMYIEQNPGPKDKPRVEEGRLFEGVPAFNIADLLGGDTMGMVTDLATNLKGIVDMLKANQGVLDSSLKDIAATARNVKIITDRAVTMTESVPTITAQITSSMDKLQGAVTDVTVTTEKLLAKLETNLTGSADDLAASLKAVRQSTADIQIAVTRLTAEKSVISMLSAPATAQSLEATVKNLEEISKGLMTVTRDAQKVVSGISTIFEK
jgi:ABC-type transporter Mla subunit MlaD